MSNKIYLSKFENITTDVVKRKISSNEMTVENWKSLCEKIRYHIMTGNVIRKDQYDIIITMISIPKKFNYYWYDEDDMSDRPIIRIKCVNEFNYSEQFLINIKTVHHIDSDVHDILEFKVDRIYA